MTARLSTGLLALASVLAASAASAQSYTAPAGLPAVVAPGGLVGQAALDARGRYGSSAPRRGDERDITTGSARRSGYRSR